MGIYADNGDTPVGGSLLEESGSTVAAAARKNELTIASLQLDPGLYWLAFQESNSACDTVGADTIPAYARGGTLQSVTYNLIFGAFTDPCPVVADNNTMPALYVRVASVP